MIEICHVAIPKSHTNFMDVGTLERLNSLGDEVAIGTRAFANAFSTGLSRSEDERSQEIEQARKRVLSAVDEIKALIYAPTDFLEHLTIQCEMLACLRWLGEFQILACIPLGHSVPSKDVADLCSVPEGQLTRVIRLTSRAGFLCDSLIDQVAHTPLSAAFVANPSFLDAAMFVAEVAAPAALQSASATRKYGNSSALDETALNLAVDSRMPFRLMRDRTPKLSRQWSAFLHHAGGIPNEQDVLESLNQLNWRNVSKVGSHVVEVGAYMAAKPLAVRFPNLRFIAQIPPDEGPDDSCEPDPCVSVVCRAPGTQQTVSGAAIYILHLPSSRPHDVLTELQVHLPVLRMSGGVMIILTNRLLPDAAETLRPSACDAVAHSRNLVLYHISNEVEMDMAVLLNMLETVRDGAGRLVVSRRLRSCRNTTVALVVNYQLATDALLP